MWNINKRYIEFTHYLHRIYIDMSKIVKTQRFVACQGDVPDKLGQCRWAWSSKARDAGEHLRSAGFEERSSDSFWGENMVEWTGNERGMNGEIEWNRWEWAENIGEDIWFPKNGWKSGIMGHTPGRCHIVMSVWSLSDQELQSDWTLVDAQPGDIVILPAQSWGWKEAEDWGSCAMLSIQTIHANSRCCSIMFNPELP